jgi:hypothetical protein
VVETLRAMSRQERQRLSTIRMISCNNHMNLVQLVTYVRQSDVIGIFTCKTKIIPGSSRKIFPNSQNLQLI